MEGQSKAAGLKEVAVQLQENKRVYDFGMVLGKVTLENVTELVVRPSGTHRLKTSDGKLHIMPDAWIHIAIDSKVAAENENATILKEASRTYNFGESTGSVVLKNVLELVVLESGHHQLLTDDGIVHIVPLGWIHIEIDAPEWTV